MRNKEDIKNYQASIRLLMEHATNDEERIFYLGIYNTLDWVCNEEYPLTNLHYKIVKGKEA